MANAIELITKWSSKAWDKTYKREAISSVLDGDKDLMKFDGCKTVRIAKFASSGLSNYARANGDNVGEFGGDGHSTAMATGHGYGYAQGDASLTWEEFTISCDRGVQLRIELFDDEETDGLAVAAATTEVTRTQVIPEVDAYVFSKIVSYAGTTYAKDITPSATLGLGSDGNPVFELNKAFLALAEAEVPETDQVIFCSNAFYNALRNTGEVVKTLRQTEYGENVKFTIGEYEGRELIAVPANRFRTDIELGAGGYGWAAGAKNINFIVCAKSSIYHPVKYDKVRVFNPNVVQDFDGYKVNVRIYHDLFVMDNKRPSIYACVSENAWNASPTSERTILASVTNNQSQTITVTKSAILPIGDLIGEMFASTDANVALGSTASSAAGYVKLTKVVDENTKKSYSEGRYSATGVTQGTYYLYGADNGKVITSKAVAFDGNALSLIVNA